MKILCSIFGHKNVFVPDKDWTKEYPTGKSTCKRCGYVSGMVGKHVIVEIGVPGNIIKSEWVGNELTVTHGGPGVNKCGCACHPENKVGGPCRCSCNFNQAQIVIKEDGMAYAEDNSGRRINAKSIRVSKLTTDRIDKLITLAEWYSTRCSVKFPPKEIPPYTKKEIAYLLKDIG